MKPNTSKSYRQRIEKVLQFIVDHVDEELTVEVLADVAHFSSFHFHRLFRAVCGQTIGETVHQVRLEMAAERLLSSEWDISMIAQQCGYESSEAFSRAFKRRFGVSPMVFKRRGYEDGFHFLSGRVELKFILHNHQLSSDPRQREKKSYYCIKIKV